MLDGYARLDSDRPFAFCSVFKMEDRKGWQELVAGFVSEFRDENVVLILRTYLHTGLGLAADNFDESRIYRFPFLKHFYIIE